MIVEGSRESVNCNGGKKVCFLGYEKYIMGSTFFQFFFKIFLGFCSSALLGIGIYVGFGILGTK